MLRSFDYAAYTQLLKATKGGVDTFEKLEPWAILWKNWTSAAFLRAYRKTAANRGFLPTDTPTACRILDLFVLEKLVFELQYELNYRPEWVRIPLLGMMDYLGLKRIPETVATHSADAERERIDLPE